MTGHRRKRKEKRFTGELRYMWNGEWSIKKIENCTHEQLNNRVLSIIYKDVKSYQLIVEEV